MSAPSIDEILQQHPARSWSYYIATFCLVWPVRTVTPFSWAFLVWALFSGRAFVFTWVGRSLLAFATTEALFSLYHHYLYLSVAVAPKLPHSDLLYLRKCLTRVIQAGLVPEVGVSGTPEHNDMDIFKQLARDDPRAVEFRDRLRTWFGGVPWSEVNTHEMYTWLYWATFNEHYTGMDNIPDAHQIALKEALELLQYRIGCVVPEGSNPNVRALTLTLDPLDVQSRPLIAYIVIWLGNLLLRMWLQFYWKAQFRRFGDMEYLIRVPQGWNVNTGAAPILFIHGLGVGLLQYQLVLSDFMNLLPEHPLLVPLQPSISQNIFHPRHLQPMRKDVMVQHLTEILQELGWSERGVTLISHSNGSIPHAWMLKENPRLVKRSCFVDPVSFCLWEGDVCHNFVYRRPTNGIQLLMRYFVGTELGVANTIQRHFDWSANTLFFEDIPRGLDPDSTAFFLGGNDAIVNSLSVKNYLHSKGVKKGLSFNPDGRHGQALLANEQVLEDIINWLRLKS